MRRTNADVTPAPEIQPKIEPKEEKVENGELFATSVNPIGLQSLIQSYPTVSPVIIENHLKAANGDCAKAKVAIRQESFKCEGIYHLELNEDALNGLKAFFTSVNPSIVEKCYKESKGDCALAKRLVRETFYGYPRLDQIKAMIKPEVPKSSITPVVPAQPQTNQSNVTQPKTPSVIPPKPTETPRPVTPPTPTSPSMPVSPSKVTTNQPVVSLQKIDPLLQSMRDQIASKAKTSTYVLPPTHREMFKAVKRPMPAVNAVKKPAKRFKRIKDEVLSDDEIGYTEESRVYDSDEDSDHEVSDIMNTDQEKVIEFIRNASSHELLCIPTVSQRKVDLIIEERPYTGWKDLVDKFSQTRGLTTDILNKVQDYLYTRQVVTQVMNKCNKLSTEIELANMNTSFTAEVPSILSPQVTLAPHQLIGLSWLALMHKKGLNGILADEMGLGKTIQVIAFLAWLKENSPEKPNTHLIVVPASTLDNWSREICIWCPSFKVTTYYGSMADRRALKQDFSRDGILDVDIMLTTYNLTTCIEDRKVFKVLKFDYVIFDEAHMLKNMQTRRYETLSQVNAKHRILLTGTPLQNNLLELMSLLTFVMPDMFEKKRDRIISLFTNKSKEPKPNNTENDDTDLTPFEQDKIAHAKKIMKPFVLRRLKTEVLKDLPPKRVVDEQCDMTPRQRRIYDSSMKKFCKQVGDHKKSEETNSMQMMMHLRKVACHPLLARELYTDEKVKHIAELLIKEPTYPTKDLDIVNMDLELLSDYELHSLSKGYEGLYAYSLTADEIGDSGKLKFFDDLLPRLKIDGHRVLIFSQFILVLNILEEYMESQGYRFLRLDGSTPVSERQRLIDEFNDDPSIFIFLLTTRAGGLGINLTAADTVIIHDMDFNPYNDKQAEDRCHRVGQTKPVTIHRIVTSDSIEEDIRQIAQAKLNLEKEISTEDKAESEAKCLMSRVLGITNRRT